MPHAQHFGRLALVVTAAALGTTACDAEPPSPEPPDAWPRTAACEGLDDWPEAWAELEDDALAHLDEIRAEGVDCGERGKLGPAAPLRRRSALDCAARFHAQDMVDQGYFGRFDPSGASERERVEAAGASPPVLIQHIAAGPRDATELLDLTWLPRPVPCSSLASPSLTEIGIGHVGEADGDFGTAWVVVLAGPDDTSD